MSIKLRSLHGVALIAGVQFVYVCRFYSKELSKRSPGRKVWEAADVMEALARWNETIGAPHDEGYFTLTIEASIGQAGAIPRAFEPKQSDTRDFWEAQQGGVPAELSPAPDVRSTDAAAGCGPVPDAAGSAESAGPSEGNAA
jgi:hypothetical protein